MFILIAQQVVDIGANSGSISPIGNIGQLAGIGAGAVLTIGGLAFLMYLLMGGFNWITAGGDKGKVEHAREMITQGIIGLAVLASIFAVYGVVLRFLGLKSIQIGAGGDIQNQAGGTSGGNSSGGSGGSSGGCTPSNTTVSDGGVGGYCKTGAANVICEPAGTDGVSFAHYEPCSCTNGDPAWTWAKGSKCP